MKPDFSMVDIYDMFKDNDLNDIEVESILNNTNKLMEKIPVDIITRSLYGKIYPTSPMVCYKSRIYNLYKGRNDVIYNRRRTFKYTKGSIMILIIMIMAIGIIGSFMELIYFPS